MKTSLGKACAALMFATVGSVSTPSVFADDLDHRQIDPALGKFTISLRVTVDDGDRCIVEFADDDRKALGLSDGRRRNQVRWALPARLIDHSRVRFGPINPGDPPGIQIHDDPLNPDFDSGTRSGSTFFDFYEWTLAKWPIVPGTPRAYDIHAFRSHNGTSWEECVVKDPTIANDNDGMGFRPKFRRDREVQRKLKRGRPAAR